MPTTLEIRRTPPPQTATRCGACTAFLPLGIFLALGIILLLPAGAHSQLKVGKNISMGDLVRNYFAGGCAEISNITYKGFAGSIGYFNGSASNIGIPEGVLLTSGAITLAPGPNRYYDATYICLEYGDPDLEQLVQAPTWDACILEFDFISFKDTVSFEYVFASEEYSEYVGSEFNDVFAFFVSGPGITGKQNIALIPGTTTPVAINTVNYLLNSQFYIDNETGSTVEYDGFTTVFKAQLPVTPCETYHMKLAIADVSDLLLDSGVFLKAGSFNPGSHVTVRPERDAPEGGCYPGSFEFTRSEPLTDSIVVHFTISGTATNGVDYTRLPDSIIIPAGQATAVLPVHALRDSIPDTGEHITIDVSNVCNCTTETAALGIVDTTPLEISLSGDTSICRGGSVMLRVAASGGSGVYACTWSDSIGTGYSATLTPDSTVFVRVTVTDTVYRCAVEDSIRVVVHPLPAIRAGSGTTICIGDSARLGDPFYTPEAGLRFAWAPSSGLSDSTSYRPLVRPTASTKYVLTVTSPFGCVARDSMMVFVSNMALDAGPNRLICNGSEATIGGRARNGVEPFRYHWFPTTGLSDPDSAVTTARPQSTTTYIVTAVSAIGCSRSDTVTVSVSRLTAYAAPDTAICFGDSVRIEGRGDNGFGTIRYSWTPIDLVSTPDTSTITVRPIATTKYVLTVIDGIGCLARDTVLITVHTLPIVRITADGPTVFCEGDSVTLDAGPGFRDYTWSDGSRTRSIRIGHSGTFSLSVVDTNGCTGSSPPVTVSVLPIPAPRIGGPVTVCVNASGLYSVQSPAGSLITWSSSGGILESSPNRDSLSIRWNQSGTFTVAVTVTKGGCSGTDTMTVTVAATLQPRISVLGRARLCEGDSVLLDAGAGFARHRWSTGDTTRMLTVRRSGTFSVEVWDERGCAGQSPEVTITVSPLPVPVISGPVAFCEGDSVALASADPHSRYRWSSGDTTRSITVRSSGTFILTVTDSNGCSAVSAPFRVTVHPIPVPVILGPVECCEGDSVTLASADPHARYRWSSGDTTRSITVRSSGTFVLTVTDSNGCSAASAPFRVTVHPLPGKPVITRLGNSLTSTPADAYEWFFNGSVLPGDTTRSIASVRVGIYFVRITDANGCSALSDPFEIEGELIGSAVVRFPVLESEIGALLTIPLLLENGVYLDDLGARAFTVTARFNRSTLLPRLPTQMGILDGGDRIISMNGTRGAFTDTLAVFPVLVALGNVSTTPLVIDSFAFTDAKVLVTTIDGAVRIAVCGEGGARLVDATGRLDLLQNHPDPFNAQTVVEYEVIEQGRTRIEIVDMLGRVVATPVDGVLLPGRYRFVFDAGRLPSGVYFTMLRTPTQTLSRPMRVMK